jgi:hypothetical protein
LIPIGTGTSLEDWQGELPLVIVNPNIRIQCGVSGSHQNNCTLYGGEAHVEAHGTLPDDNIVPDATNFSIQGVTFKGATDAGMDFEIHGTNIHVQDCLFLVSCCLSVCRDVTLIRTYTSL